MAYDLNVPQGALIIVFFTVFTNASTSLNQLVLCLPLSVEHLHDVSEAGQ